MWPSSPRLSAKLARIAPGHGAPVVVELGPGTGAVTAQVARRLSPEGRHLAVEPDPRMADSLRSRHPGVEVVNGDARKLGALLAERGYPDAKAVQSAEESLIFALPKELRRDLKAAAAAAQG